MTSDAVRKCYLFQLQPAVALIQRTWCGSSIYVCIWRSKNDLINWIPFSTCLRCGKTWKLHQTNLGNGTHMANGCGLWYCFGRLGSMPFGSYSSTDLHKSLLPDDWTQLTRCRIRRWTPCEWWLQSPWSYVTILRKDDMDQAVNIEGWEASAQSSCLYNHSMLLQHKHIFVYRWKQVGHHETRVMTQHATESQLYSNTQLKLMGTGNQGHVGTVGRYLSEYWMFSIWTAKTCWKDCCQNEIDSFFSQFKGAGILLVLLFCLCSMCYFQKVIGKYFHALPQGPLLSCPWESLRWIGQYDVLAPSWPLIASFYHTLPWWDPYIKLWCKAAITRWRVDHFTSYLDNPSVISVIFK